MKISIRAPQSQNHASSPMTYISTRPKNEAIEGKEDRLLFSERYDKLTIEQADQVISQTNEPLHRGDTFHFIISLRSEDFNKMGKTEEEKQAGLRNVVRAGMKEMEHSLNAQELRWAAGIHRNTDNPHAHIVVWSEYYDPKRYEHRTLHQMPYRLLPKHELDENEQVRLVNSSFIQRIEDEIDRQSQLSQERERTTPIFSATDIPAPQEPEWMAEAFHQPTTEDISEPTYAEIPDHGAADLSQIAATHFYQETLLKSLQGDLETFDRRSYYWKVATYDQSGTPLRVSLNDIHKEARAEAKEFFTSQGIESPHPDRMLVKTREFEDARPEKQTIEASLQERKAELFDRVIKLERQFVITDATVRQSGERPEITITDPKQGQYLITQAIRMGDAEQLGKTINALSPNTVPDTWMAGQRLVAEAIHAKADHDHAQFQQTKDYTFTPSGIYASLLRKAEFRERNAQILDKQGNLIIDNLIPSQRQARLAIAEEARSQANEAKDHLADKGHSLDAKASRQRAIAEIMKEVPLGETATLSWKDYIQVTRIAAATQDTSLFERAQSAEITNSPADLPKAKAEHIAELVSQLQQDTAKLEGDKEYLREHGRTKTTLITENGVDRVLSLNSSEYQDRQRLFNFSPSETTVAVVNTLNQEWYRINGDIQKRQDFISRIAPEQKDRPIVALSEKEVVREELRDIPDAPSNRTAAPEPERNIDDDLAR